MFHSGRATPSEFIQGETPLAPSAIRIPGINAQTQKPFPQPKEMTLHDIEKTLQEFKKAALLAKQANFDGVQIHAGNGYLVDQFLRDGSNKRTDKYGGTIQNRCKFLFQIIEAISPIFPPSRISIRITPTGRYNDMYDSDPLQLY